MKTTSIYPLIAKVCGVQEALSDAIAERDIEAVFAAFMQQVELLLDTGRELFDKMVENTKEYLKDYDI